MQVIHINGMLNSSIILVQVPWGLGEGSRGQILLNFNYKVNFKDFKANFVCLLTNERYKTYMYNRDGKVQD